MTTTRTRAEIGRASRNKGAAFERKVAIALRPWWPEAIRSRDNGSTISADTGDIANTDPRLWWSLKNVAAARTEPDGLIQSWMSEAHLKAEGRIPLVVVKRPGHADPLSSQCWMRLCDVARLVHPDMHVAVSTALVRMALRDVLPLLADAGYAPNDNPEGL